MRKYTCIWAVNCWRHPGLIMSQSSVLPVQELQYTDLTPNIASCYNVAAVSAGKRIT